MSASLKEMAAQLAQQYGVSLDYAAAALSAFGEGSPRQELLWRLNERLQGRDPGKPTHWRGLQ